MYGECSNCSVLDDGYSLHLRAHCAYCTYTLTLLTAPTRSPCWLHLHAHLAGYTYHTLTILDALYLTHYTRLTSAHTQPDIPSFFSEGGTHTQWSLLLQVWVSP